MGDFCVTYETENGEKITREFEIIVRYSREQLLRKPECVTYITCNKQQAEMIELVTGGKPLVFSDVLKPLAAAEIIKDKKKKVKKREAPEKVEAGILTTLELLGGGATKECLQRIHGLPESTLRARLESLTVAEKIIKSKTALVIGRSRGANVSLYSIAGLGLAALRKSVLTIRSYAVLRLYRNDYELAGEVPEYPGLFLFKANDTFLAVMSDYFSAAHIKNVGIRPEYYAHIFKVSEESEVKMILATNIRERADYYKSLFGEGNVLDLSLLPQGKSYRYVHQIV